VDGVAGAPPLGGPEPFTFADLRIADECEGWRESNKPYMINEPRNLPGEFRPLPDELDSLVFGCGLSVTDPIFDVTIMNRAADATILTAVGVVFVRACVSGSGEFGGGGVGEPIPLHRTYELPLPDLWSLVAHAHRERNADMMERVDLDEVAMCRLPDPILIQRNQPYRYGLRLFDFMNYCPMTVELHLWARTDLGDVRSRQIRLNCWPGTTPPALERYWRIRNPEDTRDLAERRARDPYWVRWEEGERQLRQEWHEHRAYQLWEEAGSPEGNSDLYWHQAELDMLGIHRRPLPTSGV
jgi:Protein of unknown function (DUF2934)